jgi:hypothetical protein
LNRALDVKKGRDIMVNLKGIAGSIFNNLVALAKGYGVGRKPALFTTENNPELIKAVTAQMQGQDAHMILSKLQDLEKAVYHVAAKQQETLEHQKQLEEVVVATATTVDEMLNGMEAAMDGVEGEEEESDEEILDDAWDGKKGASPLN